MSDFTPLVSVIMNCLNCEDYLKEAIDSVYSQTYSNWEIVFWDNASTDCSAEIVRNYDGRLKYYRGEKTVPLGEARNLALEKAQGEIIAFLDCDDYWVPEKLEKQVPLFKNKEIGLVYSNFYRLNMANGRKSVAFRSSNLPVGNVFRKFLIKYPLNMQVVMIRKVNDFFDAQLHVSEEYDYFMRILFKKKADYIHQPLAVYRYHEKMDSKRKGHLYAEEADYLLKKYENIIPNFRVDYPREINHMVLKRHYWHAKTMMQEGSKKKAIEMLKTIPGWPFQKIVLLFLAYLGKNVWLKAHELTWHY